VVAVLVLARILLAAILTASALAKLFDRRGSQQSIVDFGVPPQAAPTVAFALPLVELAIAAALLPSASARWGALAAVGLLALFLVTISSLLAYGRRPDCHCFGKFHAAPIGWTTVARNSLLLALSLLVAWGVTAYPASWRLDRSTWELLGVGALCILIIVQAWFILNLTSQSGRILLRLEALEGVEPSKTPETRASQGVDLGIGSAAPDFRLGGLNGESLTLEALRARKRPAMLVFSDPSCGPCSSLMPEIAHWQREFADVMTVALISRGDAATNRADAEEHGLKLVFLQENREVAEAYRYPGTPSAVIVGVDGTVRSAVRGGADGVRALIEEAVGAITRAPSHQPASFPPKPPTTRQASLAVGEPAPGFNLPDLSGSMMSGRHLQGHKTLLVFWNPRCGFCQAMLEDLKRWEASSSLDALRLVVVSTGTVAANMAMGLSSPVLLDEGSVTMRAFGATGTPMAVVLDPDLRVASPVVAGAQAILALAGRAPASRASMNNTRARSRT
jgi:peroxiredoxin/uncharacterized membrane protein YphA (DoxX/SURF4 family)